MTASRRPSLLSLLLLLVSSLAILRRLGLMRLRPGFWFQVMRALRSTGPSLAFLAELNGRLYPERVALWDDRGAITYLELQQEISAQAQKLREFSLQHHQAGPLRIGLCSFNHREMVIALLACLRIGADVYLLSPHAPHLLLQSATHHQLQLLLTDSPDLRTAADGPPVWKLGDTTPVAHQALKRPQRPGHLLVLTSGSTGQARPIPRRPAWYEVLPVLVNLCKRLPISRHKSCALAAPLYHGQGLAGLAVALTSASPLLVGRRHEIAPLLERLEPGENVVLLTVPTLLERWCRQTAPIRRVEAIITGSAPLSPRLAELLLLSHCEQLFNLYGSTEAGLISLADRRDLELSPGCVGRPLPANELKLLCPDGKPVPKGALGRLWIRGPLVLANREEGWCEPGDLGFLDQHGLLQLRGRSDEMLISGGENVYPEVVRRKLLEHPLVAEAALVARPDLEFGESLVAFIVPHPEAQLEAETLRQWLKSNLERHQQARELRFVRELPLLPTGKLDRQELRRQATCPEKSLRAAE